jgi:RNA polymerase sigma-70 factor (ECF subfamily)
MLMDTPDETLVAAAVTGDRDAFAALVARHYDRILGLAFRLTGSRAEAEDLTQDICMALPARLSQFAGRSRFSTWLYRVTLNAARDRHRRTATRARASEGWGDWERGRQDAMAAEADSHAWLARVMRDLPRDLRETVALILGEDLTQAQAAEVLGLSEGTVAWRMSEVKKRLRAMARAEGLL